MWWLFLALIYASILRIWVLYDAERLSFIIVYMMIGFWSVLTFALYKLYSQTDHLLTISEEKTERRRYNNWVFFAFVMLSVLLTTGSWTILKTYVWRELPGQQAIMIQQAKDCLHSHILNNDDILIHSGYPEVKAYVLHTKTNTYDKAPELRTEEEAKPIIKK
jgi:hypothetical protein